MTAGINPDRVTDWFAGNIPQAAPPLSFELIPSGHSNLTYLVSDATGQNFVLRRPPLTQVLATAHDMAREHRIISALSRTDFPVPQALGICEEEAVNERPFYVMEFVDGLVLRNPEAALELPPAARAQASYNMAELLARLHLCDPDEIGLGDLGRKENYLARQLHRWQGQLEQINAVQGTELQDLHAQLSAQIPEQQLTGIVHGDFKLDNCILSDSGEVLAVLDWELCTLGDVLADVAMLLIYWAEPDDDFKALESNPTLAPGFASRAEMLACYSQTLSQSSQPAQSLPPMEYYLAFAAWRLACILEGVYDRYQGGAMGGKELPYSAASFVERIKQLTAKAAQYAEAI